MDFRPIKRKKVLNMKKLIAICMMLAMLLGACAVAEQATMTVQGVGVVKVNADRASVTLGVREVAPDVAGAQGAMNDKMTAVIAALREAGAEEGAIATSGIGIYPNYDYSGEYERICGYTAYNSVIVTLTDVESVGAYIDAAFAAGANSLDYVEFTAADTAEAAEQALSLAVQSATQKARVLADAAGVELGSIVEIRDNSDTGYYDVNRAYAVSKDAGMGGGTEVLPSRQEVSATVSITFAIGE